MPVSTTLNHVTIVTDDFEASRPVYDAVLAPLGLTPVIDYEDPEGEDRDPDTVAAIGYSVGELSPLVLLVAGRAPTTAAHFALAVAERVTVESVYAAAVAAGARIVQAPREWEALRLSYYGVQVADPAGNVIEVLLRAQSMSV
jgi:catechol 2,3-dioxygenase-like lactoylglutathione lyase family enzyme